MKKEKCNKIMDKFLELDKNQKLPFSVTWHLLCCKKCRSQVRLCSIAEKTVAKPLNTSLPLDNDSLLSIMSQIDGKYKKTPEKIKNELIINNIIIIAIKNKSFM